MEDFTEYLAERKFKLYRYLFKTKPQAYTRDKCFERIENEARYLEVINIINQLPFKYQIKADMYFKELMITNV